MKFAFEDKITVMSAFGAKFRLEFQKHEYQNGRVAISMRNLESGEHFMVLTLNNDEHPLAEDEVFVKNYSENEPWIKAIYDTGYFEDTEQTVEMGLVQVPIWRLKTEEVPV